MSEPKQGQAAGIAILRNRSFGKRSPLDLLPPAVQAQLARRLDSPATYKEIAAWLRAAHRCQISDSSLCDWRKRRLPDAQGTPVKLPRAGIIVRIIAQTASEVLLRIEPAPRKGRTATP